MSEINFKIEQIRKAHQLTQESFAATIGVSRSVLSQIEIGKINPTLEVIKQIAINYCISYDQLLGDEPLKIDSSKKPILYTSNPYDTHSNEIIKKVSIPLIPISAMAGIATGDISVLHLDVDRYVIPDFKNKADYLIRISGTSMSPKYYNGDVVACKTIPKETFIQWGKVYVMDTIQGALCKRLFQSDKGEDWVSVVSDNENYPPFEMKKKEIRSLAIVIGVIRLE